MHALASGVGVRACRFGLALLRRPFPPRQTSASQMRYKCVDADVSGRAVATDDDDDDERAAVKDTPSRFFPFSDSPLPPPLLRSVFGAVRSA